MKTGKNPALVMLGEQIRKARRAEGFSQEDFAAKAGLDRSYYGSIERGERNVAALNLMQIAAALGTEVGELFPKAEAFKGLLETSAAEDDPR